MAGHSACFMFKRWLEDGQITINTASASLGTVDSLKDALGACTNSQSVNQLMAWLWQNGPTLPTKALFLTNNDLAAAISDLSKLNITKDEFWSKQSQSKGNVFVRRYTLQAVMNRITKKVDLMRDIASMLNQQAALGYVLELRFLELLNEHVNGTGSGIEVYQSAGSLDATKETWPVGCIVKDSSTLLTAIEDMSVQQQQNAWIWVGGNVTGFDAVHIFTQDDKDWIRFVQVTAAEKHSFKLYSVEHALQQVATNGICFFHVDFAFV
jgi:hypothetical protein